MITEDYDYNYDFKKNLRISDEFDKSKIKYLLMVTGIIVIIALLFIIIFLFKEALGWFKDHNLSELLFGTTWNPSGQPPPPQFGAAPIIYASIAVTIGAMLFAIPLGIASAIYIAEIAPFRIKRVLKSTIELLAGIPSVVYGYFGLTILTQWIKMGLKLNSGSSWLAASILLGIMALPIIISVSEDAISSVPIEYKEASLGLGATKWQTIKKILLPSASSGITAAIILGIGRAIGETMAVMMVAGNTATFPSPLWDVTDTIRTITATLGFETKEITGGSWYHALFMLALILFIITLFINLSARAIMKKMNQKFHPKSVDNPKNHHKIAQINLLKEADKAERAKLNKSCEEPINHDNNLGLKSNHADNGSQPKNVSIKDSKRSNNSDAKNDKDSLRAINTAKLKVYLIKIFIPKFLAKMFKKSSLSSHGSTRTTFNSASIPTSDFKYKFTSKFKIIGALAITYLFIFFMAVILYRIFGTLPLLGTLIIIVVYKLVIDKINNNIKQNIAFAFITLGMVIVIIFLVIIITGIVLEGLPVLNFQFIFGQIENKGTAGGILPPLLGTIWLILGTMIIAVPLGIAAAIYLAEYTNDESRLNQLIHIAIDNLNGTPSIIFGLFGMILFLIILGGKPSYLWGIIIMTLMILPTIIRISEEAIKSVPVSLKEAAYAMGASKWETIKTIVVPTAKPTIITGIILSMGRIAGETAPIMFVAVAFTMRFHPIPWLFNPIQVLSYHLFYLSTEIPGGKDFAGGTALVLMLLVIVLFGIASIVRYKYEKQK
ncbi:MAG: phosphate ABC transporter permease subunit PstC [Promethearchaeota archaeon]